MLKMLIISSQVPFFIPLKKEFMFYYENAIVGIGRTPRLGAQKCCSNGYEKVNFIGPTVEIKDLLGQKKKWHS